MGEWNGIPISSSSFFKICSLGQRKSSSKISQLYDIAQVGQSVTTSYPGNRTDFIKSPKNIYFIKHINYTWILSTDKYIYCHVLKVIFKKCLIFRNFDDQHVVKYFVSQIVIFSERSLKDRKWIQIDSVRCGKFKTEAQCRFDFHFWEFNLKNIRDLPWFIGRHTTSAWGLKDANIYPIWP